MEFDLIRQYFTQRFQALNDECSAITLGIGDDCAVLNTMGLSELLVSTDLLVAGKHFFHDASPFDVGYKSLAVNLSDLAAMGARPVGFTLGLALGRPDSVWLDGFSRGLQDLAQQFTCPLVGGDTTGAANTDDLTISVTVFGQMPPSTSPMCRNGARPEHDVWVSGLPGLARLGLLAQAQERGRLGEFLGDADQVLFQNTWHSLNETQQEQALKAVCRPVPRIELGIALANIAGAMIDLSDGLTGDLSHILSQSHCGARIYSDVIDQLWREWGVADQAILSFLRDNSLIGGDDYELCFTACPSIRARIADLQSQLGLPLHCVGVTTDVNGLLLQYGQDVQPIDLQSFDHFRKVGGKT